ncbi:MAG TPA: glucose-1-phosphate adenylyltransferase [Candidatus Glassbacteria bacterium]|nr:glucose-1-phosphate adenylyltransferase [Candidatus Glassbacteria bacterium]
MNPDSRDLLTIVLAGGRGERLYPLTKTRSKPAVPFGGVYRIIDFTLSNCINSGLRRIKVLSQYMSHSLDRHLKQGWSIFCRELGEYIDSVPPQQQFKESWYRGTADAIYQNLYLLEQIRPRCVLILSGDHVYKMNYADMIAFHLDNNAELTMATVEVELALASRKLGVLQVDVEGRIVDFEEKPENPKASPGRPDHARVNMGIYIFNTQALVRSVVADAKQDTSHDFGRDVIPAMIQDFRCYAFNFVDESGGEILYWRDIGTIENYYEASLDLLSPHPRFNLYDPQWPLRTYMGQYPPAKMIRGEAVIRREGRQGHARNSIISPGCIIDGAWVSNCVLSPGVYIGPDAEVEDSIIFDGTRIGAGCRIRRALIDKRVEIGAGRTLGHEPEKDREHFMVSDSGIVLVPKEYRLGG